jgi:hypothetical protein
MWPKIPKFLFCTRGGCERWAACRPKKIEVIKNWPRPANITEFRSFLGLVQSFRRFIARFSEIAIPLTNLTKKNQLIKGRDDKCENAFSE